MTTLSVAEVLEALAQATPVKGEDIPPLTYSGPEISAALNCGYVKLTRTLKGWIAEGVCRPVRVRKFAVDGRLANVVAYQFVQPIANPKRKR